jgi:hypothetical protein
MMKSNDEKESIMLDPRNSEESMTNEKEENLESGTPRTENSFNDVSSTLRKIGFASYVHHRER